MLNLSGREILAMPDPPLSRRDYLRAGLGLMLLKYAVDAALILLTTSRVWTPVDYVLSLANLAGSKAAAFTPALSLTLLIWSLPFIWIGVILSVRRARDAGVPPWIVVAFFIPVFNYGLMALLALWPTAAERTVQVPVSQITDDDLRAIRRRGLAAGIAAGVMTGVVSIGLGVLMLKTYGVAIFLLTPFLIGSVSGFVTRRVNPHTPFPVAVVFSTLGILGGTLVLFALEGIGCLIMAVPIAAPLALLGGVVGHHLAVDREVKGRIAMLLLLVPAGHGVDAALASSPERVVSSSIEIAAPPDVVWRHVVSFEEIRTPPAWYFRVGLAYPLRARIDGTGVGAVRKCEFTTGAFTEPITAWDEPHRLAFDVTSQPPPLQEWSLYRNVYAPHLEGFFRTSRGEFRLVALPGGRTRLEGRTWYSLRMEPYGYWTIFADGIIHRIHHRVLEHIKQAAEAG